MPLFMLLSGYVSYWGSNRKLDVILWKRIKGIGFPLVAWGTIDYILSISHMANFGLPQIANFRNWIHSIIGIWFLWSVLCASVIIAIIQKLPISIYVRYAIAFMATFVLVIIPGGTMTAYVYPYFLIGYLSNEFKIFQNMTYKKIIQPMCIALWCILLIFYQKKHYIYISGLYGLFKEYGLCSLKEQIFIDTYRYLIGLVGCVSVIAVIRFLFECLQRKGVEPALLRSLGQHTLEIYVMQRIVLERSLSKLYQIVVAHIGRNVLAENRLCYDLLFSLPCAVLLGIFLLKVTKVISKHPKVNGFLFGKSSKVK